MPQGVNMSQQEVPELAFSDEERDLINELRLARQKDLRTQIGRRLAGGVAGAAGAPPGAINQFLPSSKVRGLDRAQAEALILQYKQMGGSWASRMAELDASLRDKTIGEIGSALKGRDEMFKALIKSATDVTTASIGAQGTLAQEKVRGFATGVNDAQKAIDSLLISDIPDTLKNQLGTIMAEFSSGLETGSGMANFDLISELAKLYNSTPEQHKSQLAMYLKVSYPDLMSGSGTNEWSRVPGGAGVFVDIDRRATNLVDSNVARIVEYKTRANDLHELVKKAMAGGSVINEANRLDQELKKSGLEGGLWGMVGSPEDAAAFRKAIEDPSDFADTPAVKALVNGGADLDAEIARIQALADQEGQFESQIRKNQVLESEGFKNFRSGLDGYETPNAALRDYLRAEKATRAEAPAPKAPTTEVPVEAPKEATPPVQPTGAVPVTEDVSGVTKENPLAGGAPPPPPGGDGQKAVQDRLLDHLMRRGAVAQRA